MSNLSMLAPPATNAPQAQGRTHIYLLGGQGTTATSSLQCITTALQDVRQRSNDLLLAACQAAFLEEVSSLSQEELRVCSLEWVQSKQDATDLLLVPSYLRSHPVLANISLYVTQLLRFCANVDLYDFACQSSESRSPAFLGFSTGMLAASVFSASSDTDTLLRHAVEGLRLAFWLGYHVHLFAIEFSQDRSSPWSVVLLGCSRDEAAEAVSAYNHTHVDASVHLTAVTNARCVTVSGPPQAIADFEANHLPATAAASQPAHIYALYHSPVLRATRERILADIRRRTVRFPGYEDLRVPVCSTIDGRTISSLHHRPGSTLVEDVLDMILVQPVRFDEAIERLRTDLLTEGADSVCLVNIGPGTGVWRSTMNILQNDGLSVEGVDWSSSPASVTDPTERSTPLPREVSVQRPATDSQAVSGQHTNITRDKLHQKEPIAIVGMAVNFPGAPNVAELWRVLEKGISTIRKIPSSRFDIADYRDSTDGSGRVLQSVHGNFLEDAEVFDNAFFRVSPREARNMDPQQRILLQVAYHALEDAGYVPSATPSFDPDNVAVYVGAATNDYVHNLKNEMDVYYSTGTLQAFLSGKVSYAFGFGGPSVVVDTACSSAVVAIHQACRSLQAGDCNAALAGGVNVITSPDMHIGLDRAHFLSPTGQCRPWDASADGYCRSEGCGMFVLKRLSDALAENDRVLAVIRGVEINQSGTADSITHPHVATQVRLFRRVLDAAGVRPAEVTVVEAHGTGTRAGDPAEVEALREVYGAGTARNGGDVVHLTSVKANIGHAEAASGAASLAKLVLMMRHRVITGTISLKKLNPRIAPLEKDGLCIDTEACAWNPATVGGRRIAMLNNFGAAGSNAALVLEELLVAPAPSREQARLSVVLGLSCDSPEAVEELRERCIAELTDHPPDAPSLVNFAYTVTARRQLYRYRIAVKGGSSQEICRALRTASVVHVSERKRKVVFVFSGQGSQYRGMGSRLYEAVLSFRETVDACHAKLVSWGYEGVTDIIKGVYAQAESAEDGLVSSQCALFVLEYALARMWRSWGVHPDVVIGHSLGEYAALVCAEVIDLDDALRLIAERARLMSRLCLRGATGMLAVRASASGLEELLKAHGGLSIACYNSDGDCVVGGLLTPLEGFQSACQISGHPCRRLDVPFAYHTHAMSPIIEEMRTLSAQIRFSAPTITLVSTALGVVLPKSEGGVLNLDYFAQHCRDPVLFHQGIRALLARDRDFREAVWLEIGPHAVTSSLLRGNGIGENAMVVSTLHKGRPDDESLRSALAQLYCSGTAINWRSVFAELAPSAKLTDAPLYPFANTRFWVPYMETRRPVSSGLSRRPSFSGSAISERIHWPTADSDQLALFEVDIAELAQYIDGHQVVGTPLCPASVYNELVFAASRAWCERIGLPPFASSLVFSDITYEAPLVLGHASRHPSLVRVEVTAKGTEGGFNAQFAVRSGEPARKDLWQTHCTGNARADLLDAVTGRLSYFREKIQEDIVTLQPGARNTRTLYASTIYDETFSKVVKYSDAFRSLKAITIRCDGADAYALAQAPVTDFGENLIHPVFMDTLLHAAGLLLNLESTDDGYIFVCCNAQTVIMLPDHLRSSAMFGVYVQIGYLSQSMAIADAYAIDLEGYPGQVIAHVGKIRFRRLAITGFKAILSTSVHESSDASSDSTSSSTIATIHNADIQVCVHGLISQLCDIPVAQISSDSRLKYLGVDSLMSIELTSRLNALCASANLNPRILSALNQVKDLVDLVERSSFIPAHVEPDYSRLGPPAQEVFSSLSAMEYVKAALSNVLDIPADRLDDDDHLDRLGLDSLSFIELRHTFHSALGMHVPQNVLTPCATIRDLSVVLAGLSARSNQAPGSPGNILAAQNPILLQDSGGRTPLFLIHDGSGVVHPYMSLHDLARAVWGIHNPKLPTGDEWPGGILELAAHYANLVRGTLSPGQSCVMGGWSFGGVVAFEVARMLVASGTQVDGLVLIDSPHPQSGVQLPEAVISAVVGAKVPNPRHAELVRLQMRYASKALSAYDPRSSPVSHVVPPKAVMLRSQDGYGCDADVADSATARFLADRRDPATSVAGWEELLGSPVPVLDIPGNHFQPFEPENVATVAEKLGKALEMLENRPPAGTTDA